MAIFVDNGLIVATNYRLVNMLASHSKDNFETNESKIIQFHRVDIDQRPDGSICIHQIEYYCKGILKKRDMEEAKVVYIPANP